MSSNEMVSAWCEHDHSHALLPVDHEIIDSTQAPRALVIEYLQRGVADRDLFHACAVLGRLIAQRGGSPTLVSATMDGASEAMGAPDAAWLATARAALAEGYCAARLDMTRREASAAWEFPRCAIRVDDATIAIAAGYPADDDEALAAWASRVAHDVALGGARRAILAGEDPARGALADALALAGVEVKPSAPPPGPDRPWRLWRR